LATISAKDWPDFAKTLTRRDRQAFRRRLQPFSLNDQIAVWRSIAAAFPTRADECQAEIVRCRKRLTRLEQLSPSSGWLDVAANGGEFPPGGHQTRMRKARGEQTLYPEHYLVSSGHSFDRYCDQLDRMRDDGYRGSIILIGELHPGNRVVFRGGGQTHAIGYDPN